MYSTSLYNTLMGNTGNGGNNTIGRYSGSTSGGSPLDFFEKWGRSAENAFGTTGAAAYDFVKQVNENRDTRNLLRQGNRSLDDIYKKYGFQNKQDFYDQIDRAEAAGNQDELNRLLNNAQMNAELQSTATATKNAMDERDRAYDDYRKNNYAAQKVNQNRGKFAGSAINTLSKLTDVFGLTNGPLSNAIQGGLEGFADYLEENGGLTSENPIDWFDPNKTDIDWGAVAQNAAIGAASGAATGAFNASKLGKNLGQGRFAQQALGSSLGRKAMGNALGRGAYTLGRGALKGAASGAIGGAVGGGIGAGWNGGNVLQGAVQGLGRGAQSGAMLGGALAGINRATGIDRLQQGTDQALNNWKSAGDTFKQRWQNTLWPNGVASQAEANGFVRVPGAPEQTPEQDGSFQAALRNFIAQGGEITRDADGNVRAVTPDETRARQLLQDYENYSRGPVNETRTNRSMSGGDWREGTVNGIKYEALAFPEGSQYGIDEGPVSKLWLKDDQGRVADYDRRWQYKPRTNAMKDAVKQIQDYYSVRNQANRRALANPDVQKALSSATEQSIQDPAVWERINSQLDLSGNKRVNSGTMSTNGVNNPNNSPFGMGSEELDNEYDLASLRGWNKQDFIDEIKYYEDLGMPKEEAIERATMTLGGGYYAGDSPSERAKNPRVFYSTNGGETYTFGESNAPRAVKQAAVDYAYDNYKSWNDAVDPTELANFFEKTHLMPDADILKEAETFEFRSNGKIQAQELYDFVKGVDNQAFQAARQSSTPEAVAEYLRDYAGWSQDDIDIALGKLPEEANPNEALNRLTNIYNRFMDLGFSGKGWNKQFQTLEDDVANDRFIQRMESQRKAEHEAENPTKSKKFLGGFVKVPGAPEESAQTEAYNRGEAITLVPESNIPDKQIWDAGIRALGLDGEELDLTSRIQPQKIIDAGVDATLNELYDQHLRLSNSAESIYHKIIDIKEQGGDTSYDKQAWNEVSDEMDDVMRQIEALRSVQKSRGAKAQPSLMLKQFGINRDNQGYDFSRTEAAYYKMTDDVDVDDLDAKLYAAGADDLRYDLQALLSQYSALLHGEVTSPEFERQYANEIRETIDSIQNETQQLSRVKSKHTPDLVNRVNEVVDFVKNNEIPVNNETTEVYNALSGDNNPRRQAIQNYYETEDSDNLGNNGINDRIIKRVSEAIAEVDPNATMQEPFAAADELIKNSQNLSQLKEALLNKYGAFFTENDVDNLLGANAYADDLMRTEQAQANSPEIIKPSDDLESAVSRAEEALQSEAYYYAPAPEEDVRRVTSMLGEAIDTISNLGGGDTSELNRLVRLRDSARTAPMKTQGELLGVLTEIDNSLDYYKDDNAGRDWGVVNQISEVREKMNKIVNSISEELGKSQPRTLTDLAKGEKPKWWQKSMGGFVKVPGAPEDTRNPIDSFDFKGSRIDYDDDLVITYDKNGKVVYKGTEDYDPMKYEDWKWDEKTHSYKLDGYTKVNATDAVPFKPTAKAQPSQATEVYDALSGEKSKTAQELTDEITSASGFTDPKDIKNIRAQMDNMLGDVNSQDELNSVRKNYGLDNELAQMHLNTLKSIADEYYGDDSAKMDKALDYLRKLSPEEAQNIMEDIEYGGNSTETQKFREYMDGKTPWYKQNKGGYVKVPGAPEDDGQTNTKLNQLDELRQKENAAWERYQNAEAESRYAGAVKPLGTNGFTRNEYLANNEAYYYQERAAKAKAEYDALYKARTRLEKSIGENELDTYYLQEHKGERPYQNKTAPVNPSDETPYEVVPLDESEQLYDALSGRQGGEQPTLKGTDLVMDEVRDAAVEAVTDLELNKMGITADEATTTDIRRATENARALVKDASTIDGLRNVLDLYGMDEADINRVIAGDQNIDQPRTLTDLAKGENAKKSKKFLGGYVSIPGAPKESAPTEAETEVYRSLANTESTEPSRTSKEYQYRQKRNQALLDQYGTIDKPTAKATRAVETIGKIADAGFEKPQDVEAVINKVTGANGEVNKLNRKVVMNAGPINTMDGVDNGTTIDDFIEQQIRLNGLYGTNDANAVTSEISAILNQLPTRINGTLDGLDDANDVFGAIQMLEKHSANYKGKSGSNYATSTPYKEQKAAVIDAVTTLLKDRIYDSSDISKVVTPEVISDMKSWYPDNEKWSKWVDKNIATAKTGADLRAAQAPFVRMGKILDNTVVNSGTFGSKVPRYIKTIATSNPLGLLVNGAEIIGDTAFGKRIKAGAYDRLANRAAQKATPSGNGTPTKRAETPALSGEIIGNNGTSNYPYGTIGRYEGVQEGEAVGDTAVPNTASDESLETYNALTGNTTGGSTGYNSTLARTLGSTGTSQGTGLSNSDEEERKTYFFRPTGNELTDRLSRALRRASNAGDWDAFGQLFEMYQSTLSDNSKSNTELTNAQQTQLAKFDSAESAIDELETLFNQAGGAKGPIAGWLQGIGGNIGLDSGASTYNQLSEGLVNQIAQAIGKTDSLNTEGEVKRALRLVPQLTDDATTARNKLEALRRMLSSTRSSYQSAYGLNA